MDQREFAERVTAVQGSLYRVAASYLRGESDRLDAVAEAIAKAWEWRRTLREEALFATWITRILIRVCVDIQRRQKRVIPVCEIAEKPTEDERIAALREAVESLPQKARTMVVLYYTILFLNIFKKAEERVIMKTVMRNETFSNNRSGI